MAGDWIKMRVDLPTDPTVFKLAELLGTDELTVVGALFVFWSWADTHSVDGRVDGGTSRLVDKVVRLQGFSDAATSVGWLCVDDAGLTIPNFSRHNGESARERSLKNQRQARWREGAKTKSVDQKASTRPSTTASTREEKRREEKKIKSKTAKHPMPVDFVISDAVKEWAEKNGHIRLDEHFESFKLKAASKGYEYANWDSALMNAIRDDWAKLQATNVTPIKTRKELGA